MISDQIGQTGILMGGGRYSVHGVQIEAQNFQEYNLQTLYRGIRMKLLTTAIFTKDHYAL